jgi:putative spermidine/putrescine transport system permease protein
MNRLLRIAGVAVVLFIAVPLLVVIPMSFSNAVSLQFPPPGYWLGYYRAYFSDPSWLRPTYNSVLIALSTTVLTLLLVVPASFAIVRQRFRGKGVAQLMLLMPLAVPQIVMAVGYFAFLGRIGLVQTHLGVIRARGAKPRGERVAHVLARDTADFAAGSAGRRSVRLHPVVR